MDNKLAKTGSPALLENPFVLFVPFTLSIDGF